MPSPVLIEALKLHNTPHRYGVWLNRNGDVIFQDPSIADDGNGYALIKSTHFNQWLDENDLELIWFVGGKKQLHHSRTLPGVEGRYTFNFAFAKDGSEIKQIHFKDEILHWVSDNH